MYKTVLETTSRQSNSETVNVNRMLSSPAVFPAIFLGFLLVYLSAAVMLGQSFPRSACFVFEAVVLQPQAVGFASLLSQCSGVGPGWQVVLFWGVSVVGMLSCTEMLFLSHSYTQRES